MPTNTKTIALIGLGLIGQERLHSIQNLKKQGRSITICAVYDPFVTNREEIEKKYQVKFYDNLGDIIKIKPTWAFIAIPHDDAVSTTKKFLKAGIKVLLEKPLGRDLKEAKKIFNSCIQHNQLWVGFNYRFFEGISQAIQDIHKGRFGKLISINIIMGHGCHPNIKKTWKLDAKKAGGGCLIDPGIHLLDLARIISNNQLEVKYGYTWDGFWKTGIEEECHILLEAKKGFVINLQVSIVKWRSTFRIEINGDKGYGIIEGRNRSYGNQKYIYGERWGWQKGCSQIESEQLQVSTTGEDVFTREIEALLFNKNFGLKPCTGIEALENMKLLEKCRKKLQL